ncbi:MAG TPA: rifamycin-inactivating phosphotransferase [Acidimicrobiales bacterium]|nr:rifamycin-inactivating phosphotransferase [Acidimicrobiales bacterium]
MSEPRNPDFQPHDYVLGIGEVDRTRAAVVGGKGAQLGELSRIDGIRGPAGFCVTTDAFRRMLANVPSIDAHLDRLVQLDAKDVESVRELSADLRVRIGRTDIPDDVAQAITSAVVALGERSAFAVRSSATAEDLPTASFAGQQDSYLNVIGASQMLQHISRCWASLFTERAVIYRMRNGIDHRKVDMAVVVQRMVVAQASGVMFTADPLTGNRRIASVEATVGLGAALVSGMVDADAYRVCDGTIVNHTVGTKLVAVHGSPEGGTREVAIDSPRQSQPALSGEQVLELVRLGRQIEMHFGCPQDIEWCLDDDGFQIVQSRPITTLYPVPEVDDGADHVYISVGHQQMMTDPMTPLGLSVWQLTSPAPMHVAGGRLFVDVAARLQSPAARTATLEMLGRSDPLIRDALETVLEGADFLPSVSDGRSDAAPEVAAHPEPIAIDPAIVVELIERHQASVTVLQGEIQTRSGPDLLDFILVDLGELRALLFDPKSHQAVMAGMEAIWWLNEKLHEWLGQQNAADVLSLCAPNNVTAEMGLALLDVADTIRPHPEVISHLRAVADDEFLDQLVGLEGGRESRDAIVSYLDRYGMRCTGEIDIARPRWREQTSALLPAILSNVEHFEPGESARRRERGEQEAQANVQQLLQRLRALPGGEEKAEQTAHAIHRLRTFIGYREFPKFGMVSRYYIYKRALLTEADRLAKNGVLEAAEDIFFLTFQELHDVVRSGQTDRDLIQRRKLDLRSFRSLTPPRVLTSDGEALNGAYRRDDLPTGALAGWPYPAARSKVEPVSCSTWPRPTSYRATSSSHPTPTPAGRRCS